MTLSIWRYSHLMLAISSFIFILLASITGIILAVAPISEQLEPYKIEGLETITLAQTVHTFQDTYPEIIELSIDHNDFVIASVFTEEGENLNGYFNPRTAAYLGATIKPSPFFQWVTNFHRSLFLKSTGRFLVGFCSLLLLLIAITGSILILKRQKRLVKVFSKIVKEDFNQYWHIILGRLSLIPIIILTLTGVYLSLEKFDALPNTKINHHIDYDSLQSTPQIATVEFDIFKRTSLSDLKSIEFPFSKDVEDVFTIQLHQKNMLVNQYTGSIISEIKTPLWQLLSGISLNLHTGKGSIIWALILAIASANILFFIYSGFAMTFKRRASKFKNVCRLKEAEFLLLVGSENGSTNQFANVFYKQLVAQGKKVFITQMNAFEYLPNTKHIIIFTATYGQGEPPSNAKKFLKRLYLTASNNTVSYSVVGFGSLAYENFCQYALDVDAALQRKFTQLLPPYKINDKSIETFTQWVSHWSKTMQLDINIPETALKTTPKKLKSYEVIGKTTPDETVDDTFLIRLKPTSYSKFSSGDLLAIYPKNDHRERLYSIGKIDKQLQLSIKLHHKGIGSNLLNNLDIGNILRARIIRNTAFHMPKTSKPIIMIANGTGVGPFLGMLDQNKHKTIDLYLGLKTAKSKALYHEQLQLALNAQQLKEVHYAISRAENQCYVQDLLLEDDIHVANTLKQNGTIMICGSLAMYEGVLEVLKYITAKHLNTSVEHYIHKRQIRSDCY